MVLVRAVRSVPGMQSLPYELFSLVSMHMLIYDVMLAALCLGYFLCQRHSHVNYKGRICDTEPPMCWRRRPGPSGATMWLRVCGMVPLSCPQ